MGTTSARKTIVGSLQYLTMISKVAVFCLLATVAHSAPSPDPQIPVGLPVAPSNCVTEYDDIEVQSCAPAPERVCETKTIIHQRITYEQRCKEVTSKHCVDVPITEDVPQDIETCHIEEKVACTPSKTSVPKVTCTPVLGGYYGHPYGLGLGLPVVAAAAPAE